MKKRDIKRGTRITLLFAVVVYAVITVVLWVRRPGAPDDHDAPAASPGGARMAWADTLTNAASQSAALRGMDASIERFMGQWSIKGMSLAVMRGDSLLWAKGYGMADAEAGTRMTPTSIMRIASASKLVTAVAVMKLVEEGKLHLDARVFGPSGILNDSEITAAILDPRAEEITVDHLLRHTGGFTLGAGDPMFNTKDIMAAKHLTAAPDSLELTRIVMGRKLGFAPGRGRKYSNFGYMLLSLVIERVSGRSYWDYVTQEVLLPAGAPHFRPATNSYASRNAGEVRYYGPDDEKVEEWNGSGRMVDRVYGGSNVHGLMGAGGWVTSASGLARLVASIDGDPRLRDIIGPASVAALTAYADSAKMARGWSSADRDGHWIRTGTLSSTHTLIDRFPDGECWVLITNSGVWRGHHFTRQMTALVEKLRATYSPALPKRDLWGEGRR
ncbi:MAG: beta-lactamase family protein [Muribaculaceae bacterium]|nr:beta-lactamase family protein [Muribaculaceae bacterium]